MARRKKREGSLHRVLGVPALFSTAYGNVGSSIYYALGVVALSAMGATPLVFVITGLLFVTIAWSYAEATAAMPEAGGASSFTRRAFNEFVSFGIGWGQMLVYTATIAISALFVPHYLSVFWPVLTEFPYNVIGGIIVTLALVVVNVIGIKEAAILNIVLALLDLATQVLIMVVALVLLLEPRLLIEQIQWGVAPTWEQFIFGLAIGTVAYTGIETVSNMAEEASSPGRDVPRAINFVVVVVLVVYIGMPLAGLSVMPVGHNEVPVDPATGLTVPVEVVPSEPEGTWALKSDPESPVYVPVEESGDITVIPAQEPVGPVTTVDGERVTRLYGTQLGADYLEDPVLGMVRFMPDSVGWLRVILGPWVGILAATILVIATNAGIIGVSRLTYSLGQHRQLPPFLARVHPRRLTPYVSVVIFGTVASILMLPGSTTLLAEVYAFGSMISFTAAHLSVIVLRFKEPDLERPWKTPLNIRVRGKLLPVTAVIGAVGTLSVWVTISVFQAQGRTVGFAWLGVGLVVYVVYRKAKGLSLTRTVRIAPVPQAAQEDIVYDQLLVPLLGSRITDEMMVLACQLATEKNSAVDALYVIEVPMNLPLDARLTTERERAQQVLDRAAVIADQFGVPLRPTVVTARQAGRAIVEEARARRSEVILLGSIRKRRIGERVFGRTVDYVLQHADCEVLVNSVPKKGVYAETPGAALSGDGSGGSGGSAPAIGGSTAAGVPAVASSAVVDVSAAEDPDESAGRETPERLRPTPGPGLPDAPPAPEAPSAP
ncbi:MAG TPA: amino acid permease [Thermoleophilia bacterium]|nr:amino acid permease [Thermoleophilia bacterium]